MKAVACFAGGCSDEIAIWAEQGGWLAMEKGIDRQGGDATRKRQAGV